MRFALKPSRSPARRSKRNGATRRAGNGMGDTGDDKGTARKGTPPKPNHADRRPVLPSRLDAP
jgi:hypothetical protein